MTDHLAPPPAPTAPSRADALAGWRRPVATGVATALVVGGAWVLHPVAGLAVAAGIGALSWRLYGTSLFPWSPRERDRFPVDAMSAQARELAAGLRWRWEDACVNAGLGRYVDDRWTFGGLSLIGASEHPDGVIAHARLAPGMTAEEVAHGAPALAAGLEAASARVVGGTERTVAVLVVPPEQTDGWT